VPGRDSTHFNEPTDVAVARDGSLFVSDGYMNARVAHFNATGHFVNEWGTHGANAGQFAVPHGLALDRSGRVYVADRENSRLQVFDPTGTPLRVWPEDVSKGRVFAVAVGATGSVYIARKDGADAIRILDSAFRDVAVIPSGVGGLTTPHAIAVHEDRVIYVADTTGKRLRKFVKR
jgi:peptidylamidoglycolate lyase